MTRLLLRSGKDPFVGACAPSVLEQNLLVSNAGNQLFQHSVHRALLTTDTEVVSNGTLSETAEATPEDAARINEQFDAFVIPMANAFRPSFRRRLINLTSLVEQLTIPTVVVGVGIQTDIGGRMDDLPGLAGAVRAFVTAVLDRSATIGVRGETTADYLLGLGFPADRVDVIGCPSVYWNGPGFQLSRPRPWPGDDARIAFSMTPHVSSLGPLCLRWSSRHPRLHFLGQDHRDLSLLLWGEEPRAGDPALPTHRGHPLVQEGRVRFPLDMRAWLEHLQALDFAVGTRLHGAIAATLADTPAMLLVHDARTLELAEFHRLPHRRMSDVAPTATLAELYDAYDPGPFNDAYPTAFGGFLSFLERNGLRHAYADAQGTAAFDARYAAAELPPLLRPLPPDLPDEVVQRLSWLRRAVTFDSSTHPDAYRFPFPHPPPPDAGSTQRRRVEALAEDLSAQRSLSISQSRQLRDHRKQVAQQRRGLAHQRRRLREVEAELAALRDGRWRRRTRGTVARLRRAWASVPGGTRRTG